MAAGLPGVGIGGLFYLASALLMPVRELTRRARGRPTAWRVVWSQVGLALGILVALWASGEAIGAALGAATRVQLTTTGALVVGAAAHAASPTPAVWRVSALVGSLGTLAAVLLLVQLVRLGVSLRARRTGRDAAALALLVACAAFARPADAQRTRAATPDSVAILRAAADAAYDDGDAAGAEQRYVAVLARAPDDSRALFRLAQLRAAHRDEALRLYRRYVAVQPRDPWGHLALADALSRMGRTDEALRAVDAAARLAPRERDVAMTRGRVLARADRTDAAIAAYEAHLATAPRDAEAWRALAEQRRRAGNVPTALDALAQAQAVEPDAGTARRITAWRRATAAVVEPQAIGSRDSDDNVRLGGGVAVTLPPAGALRTTIAASLVRGTAVDDTVTTDGARVDLAWRPRATLRLDLGTGVQRAHAPARTTLVAAPDVPTTPTTPSRPGNGNGNGGRPTTPAPTTPSTPTTTVVTDALDRVVPVGSARVQWRAPAGGPQLDVRAGRALLDATPLLARNGVVRSDAAVQGEVPVVRGLRARAMGRVSGFTARGERATRTTLGGALVHLVEGWGELSLGGQRLGFDHASTLGFFAPQRADVTEVGAYVERESARGVALALDLGAGAQRVTPFGEATGRWTAAARAWAQLLVPVGPGRALRAELDAYDGGVAREGTPGSRWRSAAGTLGMRWAL
ncbi:tetratricopeptide repeat protein [Roseisolibacter agri]|uniref:Tetratricopeptide repeat protein n=1 Tax=Roseisolibacter agri TaxID=2014610 RepID=A0AA37QC36_9BACT|nr:tetratricopeptide repeat protein [Roseisolibacter agri]GLC23958.1 hypothetical protein rosag_04710 [Roseisolibacter agri]